MCVYIEFPNISNSLPFVLYLPLGLPGTSRIHIFDIGMLSRYLTKARCKNYTK